jgi:hypothetical protein
MWGRRGHLTLIGQRHGSKYYDLAREPMIAASLVLWGWLQGATSALMASFNRLFSAELSDDAA